jgi:hypothetical protein
MNRTLFIVLFVALSFVFVPLLLFLGLVAYIVPTAQMTYGGFATLLSGNIAGSAMIFLHVLIYLAAFYGMAHLSYFMSKLFKMRFWIMSFQFLVLTSIFSCSFLRVITYSSIQGAGGTYTYWEAIHRYIEKIK